MLGQNFKRAGAYDCQRITPPAVEQDFLNTVTEAFEKLKRLETGRRLIDEIDASGHTCVIFCGSLRGTNLHGGAAILQDVADKRATIDRYALPLADYPTMLINDNIDAKVDYAKTTEDRRANVKKYYKGVVTKEEKQIIKSNAVFQAVYNAVERKHMNATGYISNATGVSQADVDAFRFGEKKINTSDNFRLSLGLYDFLIPGKGCDTAVRLTAEIGITARSNKANWFQQRKGLTSYDLNKDEVRPDIMLGHEFVHAWRMMTGRRIIAQGWEEEMMTVGLGPAASHRYTENRLRLEAGHPQRTNYSLTPSTLAGLTMHAQVNA